MSDRKGKWYYYANERGCLRDPDSIDELGIGLGDETCGLTIRLLPLRAATEHGPSRFTMVACAHNDQWRSFEACADVYAMLAKNWIPSGEMDADGPFYALRAKIERLGYKNLGRLRD